jgi:hypothetical protein
VGDDRPQTAATTVHQGPSLHRRLIIMIPTPDGGFIIIPAIVVFFVVRYGPRVLMLLGASLSAWLSQNRNS